jgi:opacity protein-like surface antigen
MKSIILAATALALSSTMAFAERAEENDNGAGGQHVKDSTEFLRAQGVSLGQAFKGARDAGYAVDLGEAVSGINQEANRPEE